MKKITGHAYIFFALATMAFGILQIAVKNFNAGLLPVPETQTGRMPLLYITATILVLSGIGLFVKRWRYQASLLLAIFYFVLFVSVHLFRLLGNLYNGGEWTAAVEVLSLCSGALLTAVLFAKTSGPSNREAAAIKIIYPIAIYLFSFSLLVFAILHFKYAAFIATLIPGWIPARVILALLIGIGFLASAISMIIQKFTAAATLTLGTMFLIWVFILHLPRALAKITDEPEWTSLFVALAFSGISYTIAFLTQTTKPAPVHMPLPADGK